MKRRSTLGAAVFVGLACAATSAWAGPDLVPIPSRLEYGVVSVRNAGNATAGPSVVTIDCNKAGQSGGCADIPAAFAAAYTNPAYPDLLVVNVPRLQRGRVFNHTLPFWGALAWASGTYNLDFVADAGGTVPEGVAGEGNNTGTYVKIVP